MSNGRSEFKPLNFSDDDLDNLLTSSADSRAAYVTAVHPILDDQLALQRLAKVLAPLIYEEILAMMDHRATASPSVGGTV